MLQAQEQQLDEKEEAATKKETPKKAEPVYIIDDDDEDDDDDDDEHAHHADEIAAIAEEEELGEEEDEEEEESTPPHDLQSPPSYADTDSDCFDRTRGRYTSDSESDFRPYKPSRSGRSTPEYASGHRKSVSFDLSGDERSKSDYERSRSRTPDRFGRAYDSEQDTRASRMPRKGILRAPSPSSSTSSTLERRPERAAAPPPIVPTVARIREVESPTKVLHVSRATSPERPGELERENPFRRDKSVAEDDDEYTQIAKAISRSPRSPRDQFFFSSSSRSNEDLLESQSHSSGRSTPSTVISKSTENLTGARAKVPPPTLPKPQLKKADLVRNVALETFQASDVGHGDFAVFEHDASTNTIHEVPKLPVRVVAVKSTPARPRESPPPPPVNYATMPKLPRSPKSPLPEESLYMEALPPPAQRRPHDFVHENSPDNILVTPEQHRDFLLRENEMRNQLRAPYEPAPPIPIAGVDAASYWVNNNYNNNNPFFDSADTDIDNLPLPPPPPTRTPSPPTPPTPTLTTLTLPASSHVLHVSPSTPPSSTQLTAIASTNASTSYSSTMPPEQPLLLGTATPAQIFPTAQILPVQYASLPQPQQPNKLTLGGAVPAAAAAAGEGSSSTFNLLLLPSSALAGDIQSQSARGGLLYLQATPAQLSVSEATPSNRSTSPPPPVTPSYAGMKFPTFSEIVVASTDSNSNYQNMSTSRVVGTSSTSLGNSTSSSFSINSSNSSLLQTASKQRGNATATAVSYYETAEEIYSTIEEEAIYSNTAFFDSRRSSDTSLNCRASKSPTPPPLPPKRPLKPSKLRTAPAPPVAQKPHGLRGGMANFKLRSQSQPQLLGAAAGGAGAITPGTPTTPTGKETTV